MLSWFKQSDSSPSCQSGDMPAQGPADGLCILVIQEDDYDWQSIIDDAAAGVSGPLSGLRIQVVQTAWQDIDVGPVDNDRFHSHPLYSRTGRQALRFPVTVHKTYSHGKASPSSTGSAHRPLVVFPDFVLVRNEFTTPNADHKSALLALMYANVPSVNALQTILMCADKPVVQGALHRMRQRLQHKPSLPLIEQSFFASHTSFFYGRQFPAVVKLGSAHAGYGKLKIGHHHDMEDMRTALPMMQQKYCTAEPFVRASGDLRLQKIGTSYRAFYRRSTCGAWKTNTQSAVLDEIEVTPTMVNWLREAECLFGTDAVNRMDVLTIDVIVEARCDAEAAFDAPPPTDESRFRILEVNGTSSGWSPDTAAADNLNLARLVLERLADVFAPGSP